MKVGVHTLDITHPDKVLFPESGLTKGDLIDYYEQIAPVILPHLKDRPVSLQRFPDGIGEQGFFQKETPDYYPDWIETAEVEKLEEGGIQHQVVVSNVATLVYLANQAAITLHAWLSLSGRLDYPDKMIFDLDPPGEDFKVVRDGARTLREMLQELGLVPFVKTTGSRGLHVVVPLDQSTDFDKVRDFARGVADALGRREPERFTTEVRKEKRAGRLFVDYLRNAYGQTAVAPYSVRAKPGATVATPLEWDELGRGDLDSKRYTIKNIFRRLAQKDDPWQDMQAHARPLPEGR